MNRTRLFRYAHLAGHALWWVFVVAAMLAGGLDWFGADDTYEFGWTSFVPMNGMPRRYADYVPADGFQSTDVVAVAAFGLLVLAAVVEAVAARRMAAGMGVSRKSA
ncbi:hypothetical protein F5X71_15295 [Nocardia brasiliensis]|uniref:Uncharacterized protein n=1 Tax=Nocardia brasiliensis TaxID=37326 RepID=A0A6G9XRQ2_NOCBR|nr:hypothetical protein [Nocardia brasiliensis]QIS03503.1 hypothetical protein F5X71_15295 [Nocardia brasiliensis]